MKKKKELKTKIDIKIKKWLTFASFAKIFLILCFLGFIFGLTFGLLAISKLESVLQINDT